MRWLTPVLALLLTTPGLIAADLPAGKEHTNAIGMKLVRIEAGEFVMGSGDAPPKTRAEWDARDWDEAPAHKVKISKPFFLGATEVTNTQYELFDPDHKKLRGKHGVSKGDNDPVVMVTWQQAVDFCAWLSKKEGKPYRLPTEAEWEYACRAGTTTPYHTGDALTAEQANFGLAPDGKKRITVVAVGSYKPNAWGLHDTHGNVAEWCLDWYGPYEADEQTDPVGRADGWARVTRGWSYLPASHKLGAVRYARSANRSGHLPDDPNRVTDFRVVLGEMPTTKPLPVAERPLHERDVKQTPAPNGGPDATKPYFADLTKGLSVPKELWGPIYGAWNHFSTIVVCPNGDVLAVWYTCTQEEGRECAQAACRLRAGSDKWDAPSFFFGTPDCNTHAPVLLSDGKRLYHFFTQSFAGWDDAADCMRVSEDNGATWSKPRVILSREDPLRMSQPCSAFVAANGELVLAADGDFGHRDERIMTSADGGKTWTVAKGDLRKAAGKYAIHPAVVQRADGAFLAFLRGPDPMPAFASKDEGESWEPVATPFPGISVGQKAAALKLAGGALLLCSFDNKKQLVGGGTFAALSFDDGKTWPHVRKVDGPTGYMSLALGANGVIYLLGPNGSNVRCVAFNEAWLKEGQPLKPTASWVGQKVLARKAGASLTDTGKDGKPVTLPVRHLVYTVVAEDGDRVRVNYPGQEGWAAKAEWVRLSDAMDHFTARIKDDPKDAFAWSRRGIANRYAGKPDLALKDLEEAVRLAPKDADLVGIRGMMFWANKDLDAAIADYTEAVKLDPAYAVGFRNRGLAWHAKGEFDKALADYTESARVAPHYAPAFHDRATTWRAKGEPRKARDDLDEAARLDARYAAATADLARLLATCADDRLRDGKRAVELATKANELTGGKDPSVLDALAAAYAETGNFDKAVEFQKKALADAAFEKDARAKARERLKLYEQKKPARE